MTHLWQTLFGPGTWGAGGNLVAWVLGGIPATLAAQPPGDGDSRHPAAASAPAHVR